MKLRCKAGDLAMIIRDEDGCEANIGKLVRVSGPVEMNDRAQQTWLIEPVKRECLWSVSVRERTYQRKVMFASEIEHPDDWLLPIDPGTLGVDAKAEDKYLETV